MSETPSKRRKRGREDYDGGDWKDSCPYKDESKRFDYYQGWGEAASAKALRFLEDSNEQDEFNGLSCDCPSYSNGECTILKNLECSKENCVPWYWKNQP